MAPRRGLHPPRPDEVTPPSDAVRSFEATLSFEVRQSSEPTPLSGDDGLHSPCIEATVFGHDKGLGDTQSAVPPVGQALPLHRSLGLDPNRNVDLTNVGGR